MIEESSQSREGQEQKQRAVKSPMAQVRSVTTETELGAVETVRMECSGRWL